MQISLIGIEKKQKWDLTIKDSNKETIIQAKLSMLSEREAWILANKIFKYLDSLYFS